MSTPFAQKTIGSLALYRDCLRVVRHMAGDTNKAKNIRLVVRQQFELNRIVDDPLKLEDLKGNAIRGIANYITITNSSRDKRLNQVQIEMAQAMIKSKKNGEGKEEDFQL